MRYKRVGRKASLLPGLCVLGLVAGSLAVGGCRSEPVAVPQSVPELTQQQHGRYATAEGQLRSPDAAVRRQAAVALLSMDYPPAFRAVLDALEGSPDPAVRISMIRAAAFCVERRCFEAILANIGHPDPEVRRQAAIALTRFTYPEEVDSVVTLISRPETTVEQRSLLFRTLGEALAIRAVPVLLNGLADANEETRLAAYEALLNISRRDLPPDLAQWQEWWAANSHRTREDVLSEHRQALAHERDLCRARIAVLTEERQELARLIGSAREETPQTLLAVLGSRYESVRLYASVRLAALDAQQAGGLKLDERDYNVLRDSLDDESADVRRNVVRLVVELTGPYRDELVRKALADEDPGVLTLAIAGTRSSTGPMAAGRLAELLTGSRDAAVRTEAAIALGKVGSEQSVPALLAALDDAEENVRWFAVEGLRKLGAVHAVARMSELLRKDDSARVRQIAAGALGELGQPIGAVALAEALGDRNVKVREAAGAALLDLATDDADRMAVIADKFRAYGMSDRAKEVLNRLIGQFDQAPEARSHLAGAYAALAQIEKEQGNLTAAADAYEKLDILNGGAVESRRELVRCWVEAGEAARVVRAVRDWLGAPDAAGRSAMLELALEAAELMIEAGQGRDASTVLDAVAGAPAAAADRRIRLKLERLRRRLGS